MGKYANTKVQNIIFGVVTALTVLFSLNTFINSIIPKLMA